MALESVCPLLMVERLFLEEELKVENLYLFQIKCLKNRNLYDFIISTK